MGHVAKVLQLFASIIWPTILASSTSEPAWFQVCDSRQKFQLSSVDCPHGLWLKNPIEVDCVCVHGVWAISNGYCDDDARLLVGAGDCFGVQKSIRYILLIGHSERPFSSAAYLVTPGLDHYTRLPDTGYSSSLMADESLLITINPRGILRRSDKEVCLELDDAFKEKPVHIWKVPNRESHRFKWVHGQHCLMAPLFDFHLTFGEAFAESSVLSYDTVGQNCTSQCWTTPNQKLNYFAHSKSLSPNGRSSLKFRSNSLRKPLTEIQWSRSNAINHQMSLIGGSDLTNKERTDRRRIYSTRMKLTQPQADYRRETREQTIRLVHAQMNFLLLGQPPPKIRTFEYEYFLMARRIFSSVVPHDLVPPKLINGLMRMWRQLIWESHNKFDPVESLDMGRHERIMSTLNECLTNVSKSPMYFVNKQNASSHACLDQGSSQPQMILLSNTMIPKEVRFDVKRKDFLVEFAWKITMFTHFHCAAWFELNALDHIFLTYKLQSFFNYDIIKRWHNPEDSLRAYQLLFDRINFYDVAHSTDRIVEAARDGSVFQQWLSRPAMNASDSSFSITKRKRSAKNQLPRYAFWNRKASCIRTPRDPVKKLGYQPPSNCAIPL